jgi:hypothetical protein
LETIDGAVQISVLKTEDEGEVRRIGIMRDYMLIMGGNKVFGSECSQAVITVLMLC